MKGKYTRQYDLTLDDREMLLLLQGLSRYVAEFDVEQEVEDLLDALTEVFTGELPQPPGDPGTAVAVA